jgi:hypothetical protein
MKGEDSNRPKKVSSGGSEIATMNELSHENFIPNGVKITLNKGEGAMDTASIPVQWSLSQKVIKKNPKFALIIIQSNSEIDNLETANIGKRIVCKVTEIIKYLTIYCAGHHRVAVLIFDSSVSRDAATRYTHISWGRFDVSVAINRITANKVTNQRFITATVQEFDVPKEVFATKPETKWGKIVWDWANLWYKDSPLDQCHYRKRRLHAFTWKPPFGLFYFIGFNAWRLVVVLYILIASLFVFLCGWRTKPVFTNALDALLDPINADDDVGRHYFEWGNYKLWDKEWRDGEWHTKHMPITGIELLFYGLITLTVKIHFDKTIETFKTPLSDINWWSILGGAILVLITLVILYGILYNVYNKYLHPLVIKIVPPSEGVIVKSAHREKLRKISRELREKNAKKRRQEREEKRLANERNFMHKHLDMNNMSKFVSVKKLPKARNLKEVVMRFRTSFAAVKAVVCKPYAS